jgi:hypothetical protein
MINSDKMYGALFGGKPRKAKTYKVAVWPQGDRHVLKLRHGAWEWDTGKSSFPQSGRD